MTDQGRVTEEMIEAGVKVLRAKLDLSDELLDDLELDRNLRIALRMAYLTMRALDPELARMREALERARYALEDSDYPYDRQLGIEIEEVLNPTVTK